MRMKNEGFSLIELIVVIAIMTILTVGIAISLSSVSSQKAKAATKTIYSSLEYTQTAAMAKAMAYLEIYQKDDGYYLAVVEGCATQPVRKEKKLCDDSVTISYTTKGSAVAQKIDATPLQITYDHVTGAILSLGDAADGSPIYCNGIIVSKGSYEGQIDLVPETGHCQMQD